MVSHRPEVGVVREEERLARRRSRQREAVQRQRACPAEVVAQLPAGGPHRQRHRSARRLGGCQDRDWLWPRSRCCLRDELRCCLPVAPGADTCRAEGGAIGAAVATCASGAVAAAHRGARLDGRAPVGTAVGVRRADEGVAPPPLEDRRQHAVVGRVRRSGRESRRPGGVEGRPLPALSGLPHLGLRRRLERPVQHREAEPSARVDLVHEGGRVAQQCAGVEPRRPRAERGVEGLRVRREAEGGVSPVRVREVGRDEEGDLCSQMDRFREGSEKAQGRVLLATRRERSPACWTPREGGRGRGRAGGSRSRRQTRGCTATAGDRA
mmetsp:Transcript_33412/g.110501  ORF Transcript_33412/g.110501 Transcript_33412/m.110501 type:complete len:324 (-) Transcript_33412:548-1519(-)